MPLQNATWRAWRPLRRWSGLLLLGAWQAISIATAQAADPAQIEEGIRVYRSSAECETCHSWTGTGGRPDDVNLIFEGPSLVRSTLDRQQMIELLACGVPGGQMPQFAANAWTEQSRCYGKTAQDLPPYGRPPRPFSTLSLAQIEAVVAFVQEVYQGKGMTLEYCIKYYGTRTRSCDLYR